MLVIQLLICNYVNISPFIYIYIIPIIILFLPYKFKSFVIMPIAFVIGLTIDVFGSGIPGMNAAALTAMAALRPFFLSLVINEKNVNKNDSPTPMEIGIWNYLIYTILSFFIFFAIYVLLDNMSFKPLLFNTLRVVIGTVINAILATVIGIVIQDRR